MLPQGNPTSTSYSLSFTSGMAFFSFSFFWADMLLFFLLSYFQRKPAQKTNRPQARPKAKESVMIPTLLMNIPTPTNPNKQHPNDNTCLREMALVFASSFLILFVVLLLRHRIRNWCDGIHKNGNRSGRKQLLVWMVDTGSINKQKESKEIRGSMSCLLGF